VITGIAATFPILVHFCYQSAPSQAITHLVGACNQGRATGPADTATIMPVLTRLRIWLDKRRDA